MSQNMKKTSDEFIESTNEKLMELFFNELHDYLIHSHDCKGEHEKCDIIDSFNTILGSFLISSLVTFIKNFGKKEMFSELLFAHATSVASNILENVGRISRMEESDLRLKSLNNKHQIH